MSTEVDLKALWHKEEAKDMPDTKELLQKAARLRKAARCRLIFQTVVLSAVVALLLYVGVNMQHAQLTTYIGLVLMLAGLVSYLTAANQLLPMLFKSHIEASSQEYLGQLIRIKRKLEFLDKVIIDIYFSLLLAGVLLFSLQAAPKMSAAGKVSYYTITVGLLIIAWVYAKTREIKKRIKPLNDTIKRLEAVNEQLKDNDLK